MASGEPDARRARWLRQDAPRAAARGTARVRSRTGRGSVAVRARRRRAPSRSPPPPRARSGVRPVPARVGDRRAHPPPRGPLGACSSWTTASRSTWRAPGSRRACATPATVQLHPPTSREPLRERRRPWVPPLAVGPGGRVTGADAARPDRSCCSTAPGCSSATARSTRGRDPRLPTSAGCSTGCRSRSSSRRRRSRRAARRRRGRRRPPRAGERGHGRLAEAPRRRPARQRTLEAAIDWSHRL